MIENGRAHGNTIALNHLLRLLVDKGVIDRSDVERLHDTAQGELAQTIERGALTAEEGAKGAKAIGHLYLIN